MARLGPLVDIKRVLMGYAENFNKTVADTGDRSTCKSHCHLAHSVIVKHTLKLLHFYWLSILTLPPCMRLLVNV